MRRPRGLPLLLVVLAAGGCATGGPPASPGWRFPERYRANQVVRVELPDRTLDLLASVVRDGDAVEVVLFDPALQVPLLRATAGPTGVAEERFAEQLPAGNGERLAALLRTMHRLAFRPAGARSLAASADGWRFTLSEPEGAAGCAFPARISLSRGGGSPRIEVETSEAGCEAPPP